MGKFPYYHVQKSYSDFHRFDQCELTCPTNNAWWYSAWWFNMDEMLIARSSKKIIFETHQIWIQKVNSKGCNSFITSYNPWTTPTVTEISVTENTTVVSLVGSVFVPHKVGALCIQRFPMKFPPCSTAVRAEMAFPRSWSMAKRTRSRPGAVLGSGIQSTSHNGTLWRLVDGYVSVYIHAYVYIYSVVIL